MLFQFTGPRGSEGLTTDEFMVLAPPARTNIGGEKHYSMFDQGECILIQLYTAVALTTASESSDAMIINKEELLPEH